MIRSPTFERNAIKIVLAVSALMCLLLFFVPKPVVTEEEGEDHEDGAEANHEHQTAIDMEDEVLAASGMALETAKAAKLTPNISARGEIVENANRAMNIKPRFGGVVKAVRKDFGDEVKKGDSLLSIESISTHSTYEIRTSINGIVADRRVVVGAFIPENESIFRIVDLSTVWFQTRVPIRDADRLKIGLSAKVRDAILGVEGEGKIIYVSPVVDEDTQACNVRIQLDNSKGEWRVGSFAEALLTMETIDAAVTVKSTSIQDLNGHSIVFKRHKNRLEAVNVNTGRVDSESTEILSGLLSGDSYVATNSFLAKAELLKSTIEDD